MTDITTRIDQYIATWNETDPEGRRALLAQVWTDDGRYVDPLMSGEGHDGLDAMIAGAQGQFPGHRFELTFGPDAHHEHVRFAWKLLGPGGDAVAAGVDFGTVAEDGRLRSLRGFLESA